MLTAILLGPALAHLFELPAKLPLPRDDYLHVQQIYRGWALFAVPIVLNLALVATLTVRSRRSRPAFSWSLAALGWLVVAQMVFWIWTYPANLATEQWTTLPDNWEALRLQWELSHDAGALLTLAAFFCIANLAVQPIEQQAPDSTRIGT